MKEVAGADRPRGARRRRHRRPPRSRDAVGALVDRSPGLPARLRRRRPPCASTSSPACSSAAVTYLPHPGRAAVRDPLPARSAEVRDRDVHTHPDPAARRRRRCSAVCCAGLLVASQLPTAAPRLPDRRDIRRRRCSAAASSVAARRRRRPVGARRADQAGRPGPGRRVMALQRRPAALPARARARRARRSASTSASPLTDPRSSSITINAVNFVDGLDGLAAGVVGDRRAVVLRLLLRAVGACISFDRATAPTLLTAVLAGLCIGFLPHNFNPARIFMGDSGSMLLGLLLAVAADHA